MVELVLNKGFVIWFSSPSVEDHTVKYVVGSEPTSEEYALGDGGGQTTIDSDTLMVWL